MRRQHRHQLESVVATHFPSMSREQDLNENLYMLAEDVHLGVMPIGGRTEKKRDFSVILSGDEIEREKAGSLIGDLDEFDRHDVKGSVCDVVDNIARHLAWEGCAVYEIIQDEDGIMHVHNFTPKRLVKLPGWFLQIIPRSDWQYWKKRWVIIPSAKVWYLEIPSALGGRKGYRHMLKRLQAFRHLGPYFWSKDLERGVQSSYFDFEEYVRNAEIYYGQVTRAWGWNRRDWSQDRTTEFYNFYKMMTFRWAQSVLREHIIDEMNRLLLRLGITCEIKVSGLPTSSEILKGRRDLQEGAMTFAQASDMVSLL